MNVEDITIHNPKASCFNPEPRLTICVHFYVDKDNR